MEITGRVRQVGNEPFVRLVLTDRDGKSWSLDEAGQALLRASASKTVRVAATVRLKPQKLANGKRLPDMRILEDLRIIE